MKKFAFIIAIAFTSLFANAQDIINTLGPDGKFIVKTTKSDTPENVLVVDDRGRVSINPESIDETPSSFNLLGSMSMKITDVYDSNFDFTQADYYMYVNNSATGTLPAPELAKGRIHYVMRDIGTVLTLESSGNITGSTVMDNDANLYTMVYSDGVEWHAYSIASSGVVDINPGYILNVERKSENFTADPSVQLYHLVGIKEPIITMPSAKSVKGIVYTMTFLEGYSGNSNSTTINVPAGETINGQAESAQVSNAVYVFIYSDGSNWWSFGSTGNTASAPTPNSFSAEGGDAVLQTTTSSQTYQANFTAMDQTYSLTLPDAATHKGARLTVKRNANGQDFANCVLFLKPATGDFIDSYDSNGGYPLINAFESITLESNGSIWMIINQVNH